MMKGLMSVQSPLASMPPEEAIAIDAKRYSEGSRAFVLAQVEESQMTVLHQKLPALTAAMDAAVAAGALDFMALMVTDPVSGNSELLFSGNDAVRRALPYRRGPNGTFLLPGILSRKKQLLPEILAALG
jgi:manganese-dependent inorganic pyrophosphatase